MYPDLTGEMILHPITKRIGIVVARHSRDFGFNRKSNVSTYDVYFIKEKYFRRGYSLHFIKVAIQEFQESQEYHGKTPAATEKKTL